MKTLSKTSLVIIWLCAATQLQANFLHKDTKEIGGGFSGTTQNQYNYTSFGLEVAPTFSYYFSTHWFVASGLSLGYFYQTTRHQTFNYTSSYAQLNPKLGIGYYTMITDNLAFAIPVFIYYEFNFGTFGNLSERNASYYDGGAYSIDPALKIRVSENVLLSPFISVRSLFYSQLTQGLVFKTYYGMNWTYIW
ncbi:hypothetical protein [Turneriella parva]|uniref:Outer membrane protein beta-barrel domain-containing protein n=1 Tax=Turneriella parva (strain ATCC BAA-1111 / DSM 21527 / NCTC 11395 / H) TaxID=869212 RepID=I4B332_TURPD|nr:hypothetical protein [Turneriella parva]AFM11689.1 hypothetical protein Turpa_1040 [Turneriella parva DSM 21527]